MVQALLIIKTFFPPRHEILCRRFWRMFPSRGGSNSGVGKFLKPSSEEARPDWSQTFGPAGLPPTRPWDGRWGRYGHWETFRITRN